jgi:hypothetical protein
MKIRKKRNTISAATPSALLALFFNLEVSLIISLRPVNAVRIIDEVAGRTV